MTIPVPTPKTDETEDEFIGRCMAAIGDEYEDKDQALAICFDKWKEILRENIDPAKWKFIVELDADVCDLCRFYEGKIYETHKIWTEFPYAMPLFDNVIEPNIHPNCRCQLILVEGIEMRTEKLHKDFVKIQDEFTNYYCKSPIPCEQGTFEFNAWVGDLGLNTSKPYGKSLEAFQWAQDMIVKLKEDEDAIYYKVLFAFPIESMNGNVYTKEEIENSVNSIVGKSPSLNHWEDTRKLFEEGGVKYIGAEYEDGACEAILKVPKDFVCPDCGEGKTLTSLIDEKKIVNVSLECTCELIGPGNTCIGLEFDAPTLLTSTNLPGIPMARIFPLEKVFNEALVQRKGGKRLEVKVVGLKEQAMPDDQHQCPEGMVWNDAMGVCVQIKDCPDGQHWDDNVGDCVPDEMHEPEGTTVDLGTQAAPDTSKDPSIAEGMTEDELVKAISDIAAKIDKWYDDGVDTTEIEPLHAQMTAYQDALKALILQKTLAPEKFIGALKEYECPEGMVWSPEAATCVQVEQEVPECPEGQVWDPEKETCIPVEEQIIKCPDGQIWDVDTQKCITPAPAPTVTNQPVNEAQLELKVSDLELKSFQTEQKFKSAEEQIAFLKNQNKELIVEKLNLTAEKTSYIKEVKRLQTTIDKRDKTLIEKDKEITRRDMAMEKMTNDHIDTLDKANERAEITSNARNTYKEQLEQVKNDFESLDGKYNQQLDINLSLTKKLTKAQEELLEASKRSDFLETQLKKAKRLSKVVVTMDTKPSGG